MLKIGGDAESSPIWRRNGSCFSNSLREWFEYFSSRRKLLESQDSQCYGPIYYIFWIINWKSSKSWNIADLKAQDFILSCFCIFPFPMYLWRFQYFLNFQNRPSNKLAMNLFVKCVLLHSACLYSFIPKIDSPPMFTQSGHTLSYCACLIAPARSKVDG